jgi:hypothetical protein
MQHPLSRRPKRTPSLLILLLTPNTVLRSCEEACLLNRTQRSVTHTYLHTQTAASTGALHARCVTKHFCNTILHNNTHLADTAAETRAHTSAMLLYPHPLSRTIATARLHAASKEYVHELVMARHVAMQTSHADVASATIPRRTAAYLHTHT